MRDKTIPQENCNKHVITFKLTLTHEIFCAYLCPFPLGVSVSFSTCQKTAPSGRSRAIFPSPGQCSGCYPCPRCAEAPPSPTKDPIYQAVKCMTLSAGIRI